MSFRGKYTQKIFRLAKPVIVDRAQLTEHKSDDLPHVLFALAQATIRFDGMVLALPKLAHQSDYKAAIHYMTQVCVQSVSESLSSVQMSYVDRMVRVVIDSFAAVSSVRGVGLLTAHDAFEAPVRCVAQGSWVFEIDLSLRAQKVSFVQKMVFSVHDKTQNIGHIQLVQKHVFDGANAIWYLQSLKVDADHGMAYHHAFLLQKGCEKHLQPAPEWYDYWVDFLFDSLDFRKLIIRKLLRKTATPALESMLGKILLWEKKMGQMYHAYGQSSLPYVCLFVGKCVTFVIIRAT